MNQKDEHLAEARLLVSAIAARRNRLKPEDLRFLEKWELDLRNALQNPDTHAISKWRIHNLRTVIVFLGKSEPARGRSTCSTGWVIDGTEPRLTSASPSYGG